jgi:hypothetical protein
VPVHASIRVALVTLGVLASVWSGGCVHSGASDGEPSAASGSAGVSGSAGATTDAAADGAIEQVDAATSCSDLYTLARDQLDEASACDSTSTTPQCTGTVSPTCGCPVTVNSQTSDATQSYLNTLAVIQAKMCGGTCPPEFCEPEGPSACVPQIGGMSDVCVHQ